MAVSVQSIFAGVEMRPRQTASVAVQPHTVQPGVTVSQGMSLVPERVPVLTLHVTGLRILCPLCAARNRISVLEMPTTEIADDELIVSGLCIHCLDKTGHGKGRYHRIVFKEGHHAAGADVDLPFIASDDEDS